MKFLSKSFVFASILLPCLSYANFSLCEFAGSYTASLSSAGATTNVLKSQENNASVSGIAFFELNKDGTGKVNYLSTTTFFNTDDFQVLELTNLPITFSLTHPSIGVGKLTVFNYPEVGSNLTTDFVATRDFGKSRKHARVTKILLNLTGVSGSNPIPFGATAVIKARRQ